MTKKLDALMETTHGLIKVLECQRQELTRLPLGDIDGFRIVTAEALENAGALQSILGQVVQELGDDDEDLETEPIPKRPATFLKSVEPPEEGGHE